VGFEDRALQGPGSSNRPSAAAARQPRTPWARDCPCQYSVPEPPSRQRCHNASL